MEQITLVKELKYENLSDIFFTFDSIYATYIRYRCYKWVKTTRYELELSIDISSNKFNIGKKINIECISLMSHLNPTISIIDIETMSSIALNYVSGMGGIMDKIQIYPEEKRINDDGEENRNIVWI